MSATASHAWIAGRPRSSTAQALDTDDFLHAMIRRHRLAIGCVILGLALAVAAILLLPPKYLARAVMRVDVDEVDTSSPQSALSSTRELELRRDHQIETQLQLLGSRPLMRSVVRSLALFDDPEFNPSGDIYGRQPGTKKTGKGPISPLLIEAVTDRLIGQVKITQDGQTSFLNIDVTSGSSEKAARIANKIASTYVAEQVAEKKAANGRAIDVLQRQVNDLHAQLISSESGAAAYKRQHRLDGTPSDDNVALQVSQLAGDLAAARASRAQADVKASQRATGPSEISSPLLTSLRQEETEARRKLADLSTSFGQGYPERQKAEAQLGEIQQSIAAEAERARGDLQRESAAQRARESQLAHELGQVQARSLSDLITAVPLADMDRSSAATRGVYVGLLERLDTLERENELVRPDATIAFTALPPTTPNSPKPARLLVIALAGSALLAFIAVLVAEQLDTRIRSAGQVRGVVDLPTIGQVPQLPRHQRSQLRRADAIDRPYSAFTEEVRSILGNIGRILPRSPGGVVLLTSPEPGDGKTTLSLALAMAAVASGRSAVLVDLDLRRPELVERLGAGVSEGDIVAYLRGEATLEQALRLCEGIYGLQVIGADATATDPGATLSSPQLPKMLDALRARFDVVVVNTPPVLAAYDAVMLTPLADVALMVISWGRTTRATLRKAVSQFNDDLLGVVFNHVKSSAHPRTAYAGYAYRRDRSMLRRFRAGRMLGGRLALARREPAPSGADAARG